MTTRNPFTFLAALAVAALSATASRAGAQRLESILVQSGLTEPLFVCSPPGDTHRLFICEHAGKIKIIKDGVLLGTPFIDLDPIVSGGSGGDERGLLGLAFHPNYSANGRFYVCYTDSIGWTVIRQYVASGNPDRADAASFTTIFGPYNDPQMNHNGGCLQFGPDRRLYCGLGDAGNFNDEGIGHDPVTGNAQSMNTYFGKFLRFDVDNPPTYVAAGNPFPTSSIPLAWSLGWRNPWRFSFDRLTGDMYVGDVGQGSIEEVDFEPASSAGGKNYGWRCMEGLNCTGLTGCTCNAPALTLPIQTYTHGQGCSITGGYMYRGSNIVGFQGNYIYGDYCTGTIWSFAYDGANLTNFVNRTAELDPPGPLTIDSVSSFGEDASGELYICDFVGGEVYRIGGICPMPTNYCVAAPNSTGSRSIMGSAGNGSIAANNLTLTSSGNPPFVYGRFFYGQGQTQVPAYNGFRCIQSNSHRLPAVLTNVLGDAGFRFDIAGSPALIRPGSTWNFQFFYRDPGNGTRANFSDGLEVIFCNN